MTEIRILGVDPGSLHTGYGIVEKRGADLVLVASGRFSCRPKTALPTRLAYMAEEMEALVDRWCPGAAALESAFHGRNSRSLIVLAQARGALLAALASKGLELWEYSPASVKSAITGNGRAGKEQVARMVRLILGLGTQSLTSDASDALAIAICAAQRLRRDRLASMAAP